MPCGAYPALLDPTPGPLPVAHLARKIPTLRTPPARCTRCRDMFRPVRAHPHLYRPPSVHMVPREVGAQTTGEIQLSAG